MGLIEPNHCSGSYPHTHKTAKTTQGHKHSKLCQDFVIGILANVNKVASDHRVKNSDQGFLLKGKVGSSLANFCNGA